MKYILFPLIDTYDPADGTALYAGNGCGHRMRLKVANTSDFLYNDRPGAKPLHGESYDRVLMRAQAAQKYGIYVDCPTCRNERASMPAQGE